jgi:hypothetical protein
VLLARDSRGREAFLLLAGSRGEQLHHEVLDFVAEPVRIRGTLTRAGGQLVLRADPSQLAHLE